jgi:D-lactate dehydrogenase (cytochrome)
MDSKASILETIEPFLEDESGIHGYAEQIVFPKETAQVADAVSTALYEKRAVYIQGARTGICGGAVPAGGIILNLSRINRIKSFHFNNRTLSGSICIQPGVTLDELNRALASKIIDTSAFDSASLSSWESYLESGIKLFFAPNPTEVSATLGGIAATAASGSHASFLGDIRKHITAVEAVLSNAEIVRFDREYSTERFPSASMDWGKISSECPSGPVGPAGAGYQVYGDFIDFICGSEGTAGVFTELTLSLLPVPKVRFGLLAFFDNAAQLFDFLDAFGKDTHGSIVGADYFDRACLEFLRHAALSGPGSERLPDFSPGAGMSLLLELAAESEDAMCAVLESALGCLESFGASADDAIVASDDKNLSALLSLRHRITEALTIAHRRNTSRFAADIYFPEGCSISGALSRLSADIDESALPAVLMGHAGSRQISLRLLPENELQAEAASMLWAQWSAFFIELGCSCSSEYGVGRTKKALFHSLCPECYAAAERARILADPHRILNPGVYTDKAE